MEGASFREFLEHIANSAVLHMYSLRPGDLANILASHNRDFKYYALNLSGSRPNRDPESFDHIEVYCDGMWRREARFFVLPWGCLPRRFKVEVTHTELTLEEA